MACSVGCTRPCLGIGSARQRPRLRGPGGLINWEAKALLAVGLGPGATESTTSADCEYGLRGLQHHGPKASRVFPWGGPCPHDLLLRRLWCCTLRLCLRSLDSNQLAGVQLLALRAHEPSTLTPRLPSTHPHAPVEPEAEPPLPPLHRPWAMIEMYRPGPLASCRVGPLYGGCEHAARHASIARPHLSLACACSANPPREGTTSLSASSRHGPDGQKE